MILLLVWFNALHWFLGHIQIVPFDLAIGRLHGFLLHTPLRYNSAVFISRVSETCFSDPLFSAPL